MSLSPTVDNPGATTAVAARKSEAQPMAVSTLFAWLICGLGTLFYCYEYLLRISPSVMSTDLMRAYQLDAAAFGNLIAFYYYAYTPMQLPVGVLMDHYGPRRLLIFACIICAGGSYFFATPSYGLLAGQIGRFLVGFGSAFAFVGVLKLATVWLPANQFAMISGIATTLGMIGAMAGDMSLPLMVKAEGWRSTVIISAVAGLILALIIGFVMPDTAHRLKEPQKSTLGDFKYLFIGLFKLLKKPYLWLNGLLGCLLYLPLSAFAELWGVPYLEGARHLSSTEAPRLISMVFLGWAIGGPILGWVSDKIGRRCLPITLGAIAATFVTSLLLFVPTLTKTEITILLFLLGMCASVQVIVFAVGRELSPRNLSGTALAFTNMLVMIGGVSSQPIIGYLLEKRWSGQIVNHIHVYSSADYQYALLILPAGMLLAALVVFFMKETYGLEQE